MNVKNKKMYSEKELFFASVLLKNDYFEFDYLTLYFPDSVSFAFWCSKLKQMDWVDEIIEIKGKNQYFNAEKEKKGKEIKVLFWVERTKYTEYHYIVFPGKAAEKIIYHLESRPALKEFLRFVKIKRLDVKLNGETQAEGKGKLPECTQQNVDLFFSEQRKLEQLSGRKRLVSFTVGANDSLVGIGSRNRGSIYARLRYNDRGSYMEVELKRYITRRLTPAFSSGDLDTVRYYGYKYFCQEAEKLCDCKSTEYFKNTAKLVHTDLTNLKKYYDLKSFELEEKRKLKANKKEKSKNLFPIYKKNAVLLFPEICFERAFSKTEVKFVILLGVYFLYVKNVINKKTYPEYKETIFTLSASNETDKNLDNAPDFGKITFTFKELMGIIGWQHRSENYPKVFKALKELQSIRIEELYETAFQAKWISSFLLPEVIIEKNKQNTYVFSITVNRRLFVQFFDNFTVVPYNVLVLYSKSLREKQKTGKYPKYFVTLLLNLIRTLNTSERLLNLNNLSYFPKTWKKREIFYYYLHHALEFLIKQKMLSAYAFLKTEKPVKNIELKVFKDCLKKDRKQKTINLFTLVDEKNLESIIDV